MPILKETPNGDYHVVTSVEFLKLGESLAWRAAYRSYRLPDTVKGTVSDGMVNIPLPETIVDPVAQFEQICVAVETCPLFGGEYVSAQAGATALQFERGVAWARARHARDTHLAAGCATPHGHFDTDLTSIVNLLGATASMQEGDSMTWILQDHSVVVLTKSQLLAAGRQLAEFRAQVYAHGSAIYQQIQAAESVEAVRAIRWTSP